MRIGRQTVLIIYQQPCTKQLQTTRKILIEKSPRPKPPSLPKSDPKTNLLLAQKKRESLSYIYIHAWNCISYIYLRALATQPIVKAA